MVSQLAALAVRPATRVTTPHKAVNLPVHHSDDEWESVYPIIERLYVRERRKLRHVMEIMEGKHNFKATIQMYKKRFTKWGFSKNKPRSTSGNTRITPQNQKSQAIICTRPAPRQTLLVSPKLNPSAAASLEFLSCIHNWSTSFFESVNAYEFSLSQNHMLAPPPGAKGNRYDPEQLSFAFRIIVELIKSGQGVLAGRLTRKAFIDMEAMLHVEGPLFIWNVLEIAYTMANLGQTRLLDMLLLQLIQLASNIYDMTHPVAKMLRALRMAVYTWQKDSKLPPVPVLEKAWELNASVVMKNVDSRLLLMYYRLVWDSSCIRLPAEQVKGIDNWFATLYNKVPFNDSLFQEIVLSNHPDLLLLGPDDEIVPPKDYEAIKQICISGIQHRSTLNYDKPEMSALVRIGLLKSRILEEAIEHSTDASIPRYQLYHMQRFLARVTAYLLKVLTEVDLERGFDVEIAMDRMRSIIAMREFGYDTTSPQVIHDMWQLEALLRQEGHHSEASKIRGETLKRLEEYVGEVPIDMV
ncbi:hypothetical protein FSARC_6178 [Fusarium sarcochroum]|uniref:Clr5 domain-containing protein n=1 Tax=Fusarium sarcochroum TaxID=1208366 RepID=A0A8H4TXZ4_9HYPO|nr:hypothetical protein FSARC_6178 [Fusarium sarcochroum]